MRRNDGMIMADNPAAMMTAELINKGVDMAFLAQATSELITNPVVKTNSGETYVDNKVRLEAVKFAATLMGVKGVSGAPTVNVGIFNKIPPQNEPLQF